MGNKFLLVKDEVTDVLYVCSIIWLFILVRGKLGYGEPKLYGVLPFHLYALEIVVAYPYSQPNRYSAPYFQRDRTTIPSEAG